MLPEGRGRVTKVSLGEDTASTRTLAGEHVHVDIDVHVDIRVGGDVGKGLRKGCWGQGQGCCKESNHGGVVVRECVGKSDCGVSVRKSVCGEQSGFGRLLRTSFYFSCLCCVRVCGGRMRLAGMDPRMESESFKQCVRLARRNPD